MEKSRERIALIMDCPVRQHGGVEILVRELVVQLSPYCDLVLVTEDAPDDIPDNLSEHLVAHVPVTHPHTRRSGDLLAARLKSLGVQIAHFHLGGTYGFNSRKLGECPIMGCKRAGIPYLVTNHGVFGFFGYCGPQRSLAFKLACLPACWLSRLLLIRSGEGEIMVSNNDLGKMRRWFPSAGGKLGMIYHSVLPSAEVEQKPVRQKRFLCVGTIASRKGQWILVQAFASIHTRIPDWRLCIVGRFTDESTRTLVMDAMKDPAVAEKIDLVHDANDEKVRNFYQDSEVFVMPSLEEGLGLTLQEALYYGCACVTSRAGGTEDLVADGDNGLLVDRNNPAQLAEAMLKYATDPHLRGRLAARGHASVSEKGMHREGMAARYRDTYAGILARNSPPALELQPEALI